jgi:hypothetical protein
VDPRAKLEHDFGALARNAEGRMQKAELRSTPAHAVVLVVDWVRFSILPSAFCVPGRCS